MERTLAVRFVRSDQEFHFQFTWPDGTPISTGLSKFCAKGIRLLFGKNPIPDRQLIRLIAIPVQSDQPVSRRPGVRCRRIYVTQEGTQRVVWFAIGIRTDIVFDETVEHPKVLEWVGNVEGEKSWLDIMAIPFDDA